MWESWFDLIQSVRTPETFSQASSDSKATQNETEWWQIYINGLQKLGLLLTEPLQKLLENGILVEDSSVLLELTNLYWNIYEKNFGTFLQSPTLGYTRELNSKLLKSFDAWANFSKASFDYQLVLLDVWLKTSEELMPELISSKGTEGTVRNLQEFLQVWSSTFDRVFAQRLRSEEALKIQGEFLNSAMLYRLYQQQLMEVFLKMYNLPTRSEVDEVHHSIYELRKEVKSLKKALADSQAKG